MKFRGIVCMTPSRIVGLKDQLPWSKKDSDLPYFKHLTQQFGSNVVMGGRTWRGAGCPHLKGRTTYVLSNQDYGWTELANDKGVVKIIRNFEELPNNVGDFWMGGGLSVWRQLLDKNLLDEFWVTVLKTEYSGDVFMPPFEDRYSKKDVAHEDEKYTAFRFYNG